MRYSDRVFFCFCFLFVCFFQYTGIEMVNILKFNFSIPVQIFYKNPPPPHLDSTWCDETFKVSDSDTMYHELEARRRYLVVIDVMCPLFCSENKQHQQKTMSIYSYQARGHLYYTTIYPCHSSCSTQLKYTISWQIFIWLYYKCSAFNTYLMTVVTLVEWRTISMWSYKGCFMHRIVFPLRGDNCMLLAHRP